MEPQQQFSAQPQPMPVAPPLRRKSRLTWYVLVVAVIVIGLVVALLVYRQNSASAVSTVSHVSIVSGGFSPQTIVIKRGQSVDWTNTDSRPHQVSSTQANSPLFDNSDVLAPGDTYATSFTQKGTFAYGDPARPASFSGTVIVE